MFDKEKTLQLRLSIVATQLSKYIPLNVSTVEINICAAQLIKNFDIARNNRTKDHLN